MTLVTDLFQRITSRQVSEATTAWPAYRELLEQLADGIDPDTDTAAHVLEAAGKSRDDLEADVQTFKKRRRALEQRKSAVNAEAELAGVLADISEATAEKARLVAPLQERIDAGHARRQVLERLMGQRAHAEQVAKSTVMNPELLAEEKEIIESKANLNKRRSDLIRRRQNAEADIESTRARREEMESGFHLIRRKEEKNHTQNAIAGCHNREAAVHATLKDIETELKPIERELSKLKKREQKINERKLNEL